MLIQKLLCALYPNSELHSIYLINLSPNSFQICEDIYHFSPGELLLSRLNTFNCSSCKILPYFLTTWVLIVDSCIVHKYIPPASQKRSCAFKSTAMWLAWVWPCHFQIEVSNEIAVVGSDHLIFPSVKSMAISHIRAILSAWVPGWWDTWSRDWHTHSSPP